MSELERALDRIGQELRYPPTPELGPLVVDRVRAQRAPRSRRARRTLALAAAAVLLLTGAAVATVPASRHAVLDWLGLRSVRIERVPKLPTLPPGAAGRDLALGTRTTLPAARARVSFRVLVPAAAPDEVYLARAPAGGRVSLVYAARAGRPRILITEFRGDQPRGFIEKTLGPGTSAEPVSVNGDRGVWIAGRPHELVFRDARGNIQSDTLRLAQDTLLWQHGDVLVRLEAQLPKADVLQIAREMR